MSNARLAFWFLIISAVIYWLLSIHTVNVSWGQTVGKHPSPGQRHWYDASCCSNHDCEPLPHDAVTEVPNGFMINYVSPRFGAVHEFYPASEARDSQDGLNHICFYYSPRPGTGQRIRCFYRTVNY